MRGPDHRFDVADLDDPSSVQNDDFVGNLVCRREVVRDIDKGDRKFSFQPEEALEDGGPQRGVDHRYGLVREDDPGLQQQGARDHDALALPATELMGIAPERFARA